VLGPLVELSRFYNFNITSVRHLGGRVDSAFDSSLKDTGSNCAETGQYVTTVDKLFTPTVPSVAEGRPNQLTPDIM